MKPEITMAELAEKLSINPDVVKYHIEKLKKASVIVHAGTTKAGKWVV